MEALTVEELKQMSGQPVWCPEQEAYGIVMCDKVGKWAGIPFLHGVWCNDDNGVGVEFNYNIIERELKCFRVEDKKEIAMPLPNKEIGFGNRALACPSCGQSAVENPFVKGRENYPYCPWCGQKLNMKNNSDVIEINKYMYFNKKIGRFALTREATEIIYRQKEIICSYSGADEWVNFFTLEMMNLYTGLSPYNHTLGNCDYHKDFPQVFKEDKEKLFGWVEASLTKEWGKKMYAMIENIIDDLPFIDID